LLKVRFLCAYRGLKRVRDTSPYGQAPSFLCAYRGFTFVNNVGSGNFWFYLSRVG